ncbi:AAA family ATPase [Aeromicrobium sp.]|uniref:AAA family ATPase n=1 Tax=Aeromicrobium sp. TaxID=1871063 RepID=UPI0019BF0250|nr:AAA family ATPase [Aeromicrobium sp.]MBC7632449.1 AAA family ATPase [Aeromicrobium sp.]
MSTIWILAANTTVTEMVTSLPGHDVVSMDRDQVTRMTQTEGMESFAGSDARQRPDIVVLGDDIPVGEALSIAHAIDTAAPQVEVILVAEPDTDLALRAMRVGIREIVVPAILDDDLKVLIHRVTAALTLRTTTQESTGPAGAEAGRIVVVISPKGGVGKSTIASNLMIVLARHAPMETVLVDLDVQFGDAANLLDLKPAHSLEDAFGTSAALDTLILKTFLTVHPAGFYVLCGAESPTVGDRVQADHVKRLLGQLASQFKYVVVDTSSGLTEHTLAALEEANDAVLVSSMDVTSIRALRREVDLLSELELLPAARHLVVNFADRRSGLNQRDIENVVGMPVAVTIPRSAEAPLAGNRGEPLMLAKRPGPVANGIVELADLLTATAGTGVSAGKKSRRRGRKKSEGKS